MKRLARIGSTFVVVLLAIGSQACQREEGPAEKAGKALDETMKEAASKMHDAGERVGEAVEEAGEHMGEAVEDAGEAMQNE